MVKYYWFRLKVKQVNKVGFYYRILEDSRNSSFSKEVEHKLRSLIYKRHIELYISNGLDPVNLMRKVRENESEIYDLNLVKSSFEYKLGKVFMSPFRMVQKLFKYYNNSNISYKVFLSFQKSII